MHRKFYLHANPGSSIIDEVTKVAKPNSIFTREWESPIRVIPTIQFFPETQEMIEGEDAIRAYLDSIRPRPMARERNIAPIKTKPVATQEKKSVVDDKPKPKKTVNDKPVVDNPVTQQSNEEVLKSVRSQLTEELQNAKTSKPNKKPRKTTKQ